MPDPTGPGDQPRPSTPRLDHAPGDRYRGAGTATGGPTTGTPASPGTMAPGLPDAASDAPQRRLAIVAGMLVGVVGAILFALLSQVDLGAGLLVVAMVIGWAVALALVWNGAAIPRRAVVGGVLAGAAIVGGLLLAWAWGRLEGGALGPLDYVNERYGPLAYLDVVAAAAVAWFRSR